MTYTEISEPYIKKTNYGKTRSFVLCKCSCGIEKEVELSKRKSGKTLKCIKCTSRKYVGKISGYFFAKIRCDAKRRGIDFQLTKEYMWDLYLKQNGECKLTGWKIDFADGNWKHQHGETSASLDRIDSSNGYVEGNVQWLHKDVNFLKQRFSQEYVIKICKAITENRSKDG